MKSTLPPLGNQAFMAWIIKSLKEKRGLVLQKFNWTERVSPELFDFGCQVSVDGDVFSGSGTSACEFTAITKAVAEAIERSVWGASGEENTNGFAAHVDLGLAKESAVNELVERHVFAKSFSCQSFGADITREIFKFDALSIFRTAGVDFRLNLLANVNGLFVVMVSAFGISLHQKDRRFGTVVGLGTGYCLRSAISKSIAEVVRDLAYLILGNRFSDTSVSFVERSIEQHRSNCMKIEFGHWYMNLLDIGNKDESSPFGSLASFDVVFKLFGFRDWLLGCPLHVVRASSRDLLPLKFGRDQSGLLHPLV